MKPVEPIFTASLFQPLHAELIALLRGLSNEDRRKPTAAPLWEVAGESLPAEVLSSSEPPPPASSSRSKSNRGRWFRRAMCWCR